MKKETKKVKKISLIDLLNCFIAVVINLAIFYLVIRFLPKLLVFFFPLIFGFIISLISERLVERCEEKLNIPRNRISLVIVILVTVILVGVIFGIGYYIYQLILHSSIDVKILIKDLNATINEAESFINRILENSPFAANVSKITIPLITVDNAILYINELSEPIMNFLVNLIKNIPIIIVNIVFAILSAYVLINDNKEFRSSVKKIMPKSLYDLYKYLKKEVIVIFNGWLKAQFIVVALVFIVLLMGMFIMKVKHPVLLALLITVVDALPIFGSGFFLWPWAVYCIIQKEIFNLIVIILVYAAIQFIRSVVQNKIMSSDYGLNAVMTIFILFVGFKLYGFVGLIFAIPVGVLIVSLYKFGIFDNFILSIKKLFLYTKMFLEQNL